MSKMKIPDSWASEKLGEFLRIRRGASPRPVGDPRYFGKGECGWLKISDLTKQGKYITQTNEFVTDSGKQKSVYVPPGDLVLSNSATIGLPAITKVPICVHDGFLTFPNLPKEIDVEFLYYFFLAFRSHLQNKSIKGATQANLNIEIVSNINCPIPPVGEQKRIVAKLESAQTKIGNLKTNIAKAESLVSLYRDSILRKAFSGKLVSQKSSEEPASALLTRIRSERAKKNGTKKKNSDLPLIKQEEIPFDIPSSWEWVRLGEVIELINGDRSSNYPNVSEYVETGIPWINTGHIQPDGSLSEADMNYITRKKFDSLRGGKIEKNDLVYCLRGATLGKTAFVAPFLEGAIASSLVILRPFKEINGDYLYHFLTSALGEQLISRFDNGSAQPNLSANSVALYVFPLPPALEQERIANAIKVKRNELNNLEARFGELRTTITMFNNSMLMAAFQGRATPQDPAEGNGHDLLKKIKCSLQSDSLQKPKRSFGKANSTKKVRTKR